MSSLCTKVCDQETSRGWVVHLRGEEEVEEQEVGDRKLLSFLFLVLF